MRRRARGFTLVELMVVVTIIGVIASIAIVSMRRSRSTGDADAWANTIRNAVNQVRRRAVSVGKPYLLDLRANKISWCEVVPPPSLTTACPDNVGGEENLAGFVSAPADGVVDSWAAQPDTTMPNVTYAAVTRTAIGTGKSVYFGPNGTVDPNYDHTLPGAVPSGFTVYVRASNNTTPSTSSQAQKHRRVIIYGVSGRPRIIDNW